MRLIKLPLMEREGRRFTDPRPLIHRCKQVDDLTDCAYIQTHKMSDSSQIPSSPPASTTKISSKDDRIQKANEVINAYVRDIGTDAFKMNFQKVLNEIEQETVEKKLSSLTIEAVADYMSKKAKNIIVLCGAGISTSAGVPDFRSPGTGLYNNFSEYNLPDPMAVFDIRYFLRKPEPFFKLAKRLFPKNVKPTYAHYFIRLLQEKGVLLRLYTQNIDSLETMAGIREEKYVAAHGSRNTSRCVKCKTKYNFRWMSDKMFDEGVQVPLCDKCGGVVKPDIVFFGEDLPEKFHRNVRKDFPKCDLLIILGTSLVVQPFAGLINEVNGSIPRILINLNDAGMARPFERLLGNCGLRYKDEDNYRDVFWQGTCDDGVKRLAELLNWGAELCNLVETEWRKIDAEIESNQLQREANTSNIVV